MKKLLFFMVMSVFASMNAMATINIYSTNVKYGTWYGEEEAGLGIYDWDNAGDIAALLEGTYTGDVWYGGENYKGNLSAIVEILASQTAIKIGGNKEQEPLGATDLAALNKLTNAKYIDMDKAEAVANTDFSKITAGSSVLSVSLPDGLTKAQVNAAGKALAACNANFGACVSEKTVSEVTETTCYYVVEDGKVTSEEYTGSVTERDGSYYGSVTKNEDVALTVVGSRNTYVNTWNNNKVLEATNVVDGKVTPDPLEVKLDGTKKVTLVDGGQELDGWMGFHEVDGKYYVNDGVWMDGVNIGGKEVNVTLENPTYYNQKTYTNETYSGTVIINSDGSFSGTIDNSGDDAVSFDVTTEYTYSYTDHDGNAQTEVSNEVKTTKNIQWNEEITLSKGTKETSTTMSDVTAYVNTPGSLYQANCVAEVKSASVRNVTLSGNISLDDLAYGNANDTWNNKGDVTDTQYDASVSSGRHAWNTNGFGNANIKSFDLEDATVNNIKYLRLLQAYEKLETVIFPKNITEIPIGCLDGRTTVTTVVLPPNVTTIGAYAFESTSITGLELPSTITSVGKDAYADCKALESVVMASLDAPCTFGDEAFMGCLALKHVTLSEGVTGISKSMFETCGMLESIRIPTSCKVIDDRAFYLCVSLHVLTIPEGVERINRNVFDLAGLTDIYVMATSPEKVPLIYDIGNTGDRTDGTFTKKNIAGNNTDPWGSHKDDDLSTVTEEQALSWYQEEFSDMNVGIGGNNCMLQLHYPENMYDFYNAISLLPAGWMDNLSTSTDKEIAEFKIDGKTWLPEAYTVGSHEYDTAKGTNKGNSAPVIGPTVGGLYWPTQTDYAIRLAAGYTASGEQSNTGWRQIPLQGIATSDNETFTKKYDDTWYTMCFPWDMDDNTLFNTFNQKCEITEFVGAEVLNSDDPATENVVEYNLVFHFDHVAPTYYMNPSDNYKEYERLSIDVEDYKVDGKSTTRTEEVKSGSATLLIKYYTYKSSDGEYVYWPFGYDTAEKLAMRAKYNAIKHLMVFAGRPYMIHPSVGAKPGNPQNCTISGVSRVKLADFGCNTWNELANLRKVSWEATTDGKFQHQGVTKFINPETKEGGSYYFIGNITDGPKNMLDEQNPAYFLAVTESTGTDTDIYPKYYRKTTGGMGKWSQYSAIICPDADALTHIEGLNGMAVSSTSEGCKVAFGEWEEVTATAIDEIIADAVANEQPVKQVHLNVVFDINGQVVRTGTPSVEGLPKGLYIVNGKKYMVK